VDSSSQRGSNKVNAKHRKNGDPTQKLGLNKRLCLAKKARCMDRMDVKTSVNYMLLIVRDGRIPVAEGGSDNANAKNRKNRERKIVI
jgi:hypothetical protein